MLDYIFQRSEFTFGPLLTTFLLGLSTVLLWICHSFRKQRYWKKIGIPYVPAVPILGSRPRSSKQCLHEMELDRYNEYGRVYGHYEGSTAVLSVAEPEILRNIFVKDFPAFTGRRRLQVTGDQILENMLTVVQGEDWKRIRAIVTPTFTTGKIKRMTNIFKDCSRTLVRNFRETIEEGELIDAKRFYGAFTMDVIASSAFSTKIDSHNDPNNEFVAAARKIFDGNSLWRLLIFSLFPTLTKLFKIHLFPPDAMNFFKNATLQIIEQRRRTGQTGNDFLQLLLDTAKELSQEGKLDLNEKDDITENYGKEDNDQMFKQSVHTKKTLSQDELVAQCVLFFVAGYDTTASALSFASYFLALNPDIQEKLVQELDDALRKNNGELTYEAIQSMKYLDNVISETLRLYPPLVRIERVADEDYKLEDAGITVPKDMIVTIPIYAMHRDPELFPDPEKFDPDRFTPEERAKRHPYSYLPFGVGPRNCVGMRFALVEMKVCLAYILSNFRFKRCPQTEESLEFYIVQGLLQPKHITLDLEVRRDTVRAL